MAPSHRIFVPLLSLLSFVLTVSAFPPWPVSTPMPCAMLSPYTTVRDASMMASCCAILERQAASLGAMADPVPAPCLSSLTLPLPSPDGLLAECEPCEDDSECSQGSCWGEPKMCTDFSYKSLNNCFKKECIHCKMDEQCSTKRCWLGRCAYESTLSQVRCFPVHLLDLIKGR